MSLWVLNSKCANTRKSMTSSDQNISILFMSNRYLKIFNLAEKLYIKICYNSKSNSKFQQLFLSDFQN